MSMLGHVISAEQQEFYAASGYLQLDSFIVGRWLADLQEASAQFIEQSRSLSKSNRSFDLEPDHSAERPRLRRLTSPVDHHETFRRFAFDGPAAQLAQALLGGPVRFHHSKLNYKWADGGEEVKWHQDIQFWPHTDFSPLTIGVYLDDVDDEMGPMGVLPGSHRGPLFDLYGSDGSWAGAICDADIETLDLSRMAWLAGPAGSVTVHNCAMVHGSLPNNSARPRPLLLQTYSAIDSFPIADVGANGSLGRSGGTVIGVPAAQELEVPPFEIQGRSLRGAPNWATKGAPTIFGSQQAGPLDGS